MQVNFCKLCAGYWHLAIFALADVSSNRCTCLFGGQNMYRCHIRTSHLFHHFLDMWHMPAGVHDDPYVWILDVLAPL